MALRQRGIVYDVGVEPFAGRPSRPHFDDERCRRDLAAIADDLHCTAVRITGRDLDRVEVAARHAVDRGLEVWLSPMLHDADADTLLGYFADAARLAERLRRRDQAPVVLVVGWELTFFMRGLLPGDTATDRMRVFLQPWRLLADTVRRGPFHRRLNAFLTRAVAVVRQEFAGQVTYASGAWESVDWGPFDLVAVDCYRDRRNRRRFAELVRGYARHGKPVVATEFGCCTYEGARDRGAMGWAVVDRGVDPPRVKGDLRRSEQEQADELDEVLTVFEDAGVSGAFVFTFASWTYPHHPDPAYDLDLAAYGVVACDADGDWRPKQAFDVIARRYGG